MFLNIHELDEDDILQLEITEKIGKDRMKRLQQYRNFSHKCGGILCKIFTFWHQKKNSESKSKVLGIVSEKKIINLSNFIQEYNRVYNTHQQFSKILNQIQSFKSDCKAFVEEQLAQCCSLFIPSKMFDFAIYCTKNGKFCIKMFVKEYQFELNQTMKKKKIEKIEPFWIEHPQLIKKLQLLKKNNFPTHLLPRQDIWDKVQQFYDAPQKIIDEQILQLQIYENYPLLRNKMYLPIVFEDSHTKTPLKGPIYSNSFKDCMYAHFVGYNEQTMEAIQDQACNICGAIIQSLEQNPILTYLQNNNFNPAKQNVVFCPEYNRFKLIKNINGIKSIGYANYMHFRANIKKKIQNKRLKYIYKKNEKQKLVFNFHGQNILLRDPAKTKFCDHLSFCDLRQLYLRKNQEENSYQCPICQVWARDDEIIYLKETTVIFEFIRWKSQNDLHLQSNASLFINHLLKQVVIYYQQFNKNKQIIQCHKELKQLYYTLENPLKRFASHQLGIPNKKVQAYNNKYLYNGVEGLDQADDDDQTIQEKQEDSEEQITEMETSS